MQAAAPQAHEGAARPGIPPHTSASPPWRQADVLPAGLSAWLDAHADALDSGAQDPATLLPALADAGLFRWGVPAAYGGIPDTDAGHAIEAIAAVGSLSMAAAFVGWSQRSFIEFLLHTPNRALAGRWLPELVRGRMAGATALSNAMKYLSGIESLQISAREDGAAWRLDGVMPWVTNLRPQGFLVAAAVARPDGQAAVVALPHDAPGLARGADLELMGLRSTNTAAITVAHTPAGEASLLHADARAYLPALRPVFVGLQCALSIGLARRGVEEARSACPGGAAGAILAASVDALSRRVEAASAALIAGVRAGALASRPLDLFELRIELAESAGAAVQLELQACGGAAYLTGRRPGFARRWREAAFVPIVTPSLLQLRTEIARKRGDGGADR
ncbi:acyl-CoA dehydrogenase [Bordetella genomosp. 10]|uniref:Acyl-CoA dehydrogenase n=2 Tax=Bordetella genomosp. 10 TaxID=1416804 RepID=A0A261SMK4_9BORD|nr:acyl-CoA dehydrogenase [Bordetella genomosp. 10]